MAHLFSLLLRVLLLSKLFLALAGFLALVVTWPGDW